MKPFMLLLAVGIIAKWYLLSEEVAELQKQAERQRKIQDKQTPAIVKLGEWIGAVDAKYTGLEVTLKDFLSVVEKWSKPRESTETA